MNGFGEVEFQAVLLRRMQDFRPELVDRARGELGLSAATMRQVNADWQRLLRSRRAPDTLARTVAVLGPAASVRPLRVGELTCTLHRWPLPLWPELRWEVVQADGGGVLQEWLVRPEGARPPALAPGGVLTPWQYVVGDLGRVVRDVRTLPSDAPSRWACAFTAPDGAPRRAVFVHGLLQRDDPGGGASRASTES